MSNGKEYQDLLEQIRAGDEAAANILAAKFWRGAYFVLYRQSGERQLSQDLAQDTIMIVLDKAQQNQIKSAGALPAYVRQTAINLLIAHRRKQKRQNPIQDEGLISRLKAPDLSPAFTLDGEQLAKLVHKVINELPVPRDVEILRRHYLLEQDKKTICVALDLSAQHYDRVLYRARLRLKQALLDDADFDGFDPDLDPMPVLILVVMMVAALVARPDYANPVGDSPATSHYHLYNHWESSRYG